MQKINVNTYIKIHAFIVLDLVLRVKELMIYAIIWRISQKYVCLYLFVNSKIAEWLLISEIQTRRTLSNLVESGSVVCKFVNVDGHCCNNYMCTDIFKAKKNIDKFNKTAGEYAKLHTVVHSYGCTQYIDSDNKENHKQLMKINLGVFLEISK